MVGVLFVILVSHSLRGMEAWQSGRGVHWDSENKSSIFEYELIIDIEVPGGNPRQR